MSNSTDTQLSIVDQLKSQLTDIKDKLKELKNTSTSCGSVFDLLTGSAKLLQDKLDFFLKNKGFYTQSDVNDAYATMQEVQRRQMEADTKRAKNRALLYAGLGIAGIFAIYFVIKKMNK